MLVLFALFIISPQYKIAWHDRFISEKSLKHSNLTILCGPYLNTKTGVRVSSIISEKSSIASTIVFYLSI